MKPWIGVILFFGFGAAVGFGVAYYLARTGSSVAGALLIGAFVGALAATFAAPAVYWLSSRRKDPPA